MTSYPTTCNWDIENQYPRKLSMKGIGNISKKKNHEKK